jgi:hypothetical protein
MKELIYVKSGISCGTPKVTINQWVAKILKSKCEIESFSFGDNLVLVELEGIL